MAVDWLLMCSVLTETLPPRAPKRRLETLRHWSVARGSEIQCGSGMQR